MAKSGRVLTDEDFERLADEAERGYDVEALLARRVEPIQQPDWWIEGRKRGLEHPCPLCRAEGYKVPLLQRECFPNAVFPREKCFHCNGTGDESAAIRRNRQGGRDKR